MSQPLQVDAWGFFGSQQGLRYAADATIGELSRHGAHVRRHTVSDSVVESMIEAPQVGAPTGVNLFHINPDQLRLVLRAPHEDPRFETRLNVAIPFWEVTELPRSWRPVLEAMDLIVAPTPFIGEIMRGAELGVPLVDYSVVVDVPKVQADRQRFGLPEDVVVYGFAFGSEAVLERKNPLGAVQAFLHAFPAEGDVRLAVRVNPTGASSARIVDLLSRASGNDPRVIYVCGDLGYREVLSFYASLDAYVSLHRAEGLGLGIMECMAVGTPVIATAWSGNSAFMSSQDSLLVGYDVVPVPDDPDSPYRSALLERQALWAEPSLDDAVAAMRLIRDDPEVRGRMSVDARKAYERVRDEAHANDLTVALVQALGGVAAMKGPHSRRAARLRAIEREERLASSLMGRAARRVRRLLRLP